PRPADLGRGRAGAPGALPGADLSFEDVIRRQLDLFGQECAELVADCDNDERASDASGRHEAEERYADYLDLVETGTERLAELRDNFLSTMSESDTAVHAHEFTP